LFKAYKFYLFACFNVEKIQHKNVVFTVWDVAGSKKLRALWRHYFNNCDGLVGISFHGFIHFILMKIQLCEFWNLWIFPSTTTIHLSNWAEKLWYKSIVAKLINICRYICYWLSGPWKDREKLSTNFSFLSGLFLFIVFFTFCFIYAFVTLNACFGWCYILGFIFAFVVQLQFYLNFITKLFVSFSPCQSVSFYICPCGLSVWPLYWIFMRMCLECYLVSY